MKGSEQKARKLHPKPEAIAANAWRKRRSESNETTEERAKRIQHEIRTIGPTKIIRCVCGASFGSEDGYSEHVWTMVEQDPRDVLLVEGTQRSPTIAEQRERDAADRRLHATRVMNAGLAVHRLKTAADNARDAHAALVSLVGSAHHAARSALVVASDALKAAQHADEVLRALMR